MSDKDPPSLSVSISRGLTDKLVERRKGAALELERLVKDHMMMNDYSQIKQVIYVLENEFTLSTNPNTRKGGLVGLAAIAIALGRGSIGISLPELVRPVLTCFEDPDARVRYYACEALYNISKVARGAVLVFFNSIFEGLCKLSCDSDSNVRYGAELLDRLMKDVVSENPHFDVDTFISLLRDRIYSKDGYARQFLVSWVSFLDSVPDIHIQEHVQEFIDGLFLILGDERKEIRRMTEEALGELLKEIQQHSATVRFDAMANIIAVHSQSSSELIQFTAITWLKVFLDLAGRSMMKFTSNFLLSILPCVAYDAPNKSHIKRVAFEVNDRLKKLLQAEDDEDTSTDEEAKCSNTPMEPRSQKISPPQPPTSQAMMAKLTPQMSPKHTARTTVAAQSDSKNSPSGSNTSSPKLSPKSAHTSPNESPEKIWVSPPSPPKDASTSPTFHLLPVLGVLINHMQNTRHETRMETLRWIMWLQQSIPKRIYLQAGKLFPALLGMLTDQYDKVLKMALQVLSILSTSKVGLEIDAQTEPRPKPALTSTLATQADGKPKASTDTRTRSPVQAKAKETKSKAVVATTESKPQLNKYFRLFLLELLKMFGTDRALLERKGNLLIRQLCLFVGAYSVYCTLAEILLSEEDFIFASIMVQYLNLILFTASELYGLRMQLKDLTTTDNWTLFTTLYRSWSHNPVATVALCLLTQNYDHASNLVLKFANIEITASLLKEIDRLVQLVESPIFSHLRLQLLAPLDHASLVRTLYGLLMLLPQSSAFNLLKNRLSCVPVITEVEQEAKVRRRKPHRTVPSNVSFDDLLEHFVTVQRKHSVLAKEKATQRLST
ncbi:protein VAC14 homolog isoform X2 [Halichondria panicea]|uniref:protein VAC14 homolog isoform X1 n=1 Tax=Halichondria panicea TaxID=6063 RepID=UPI00312B801F